MRLFLFIWALACVVACVFALGYMAGEANAALINGTAADDYLVGTNGKDTIKAYAGRDELHGKGGDDLLNGGRGRDLVEGGGGNDYLIGGRNADVLYAAGGTSGIDYVSCGGGEDWAYVGPLDTAAASCEHVQVLG